MRPRRIHLRQAGIERDLGIILKENSDLALVKRIRELEFRLQSDALTGARSKDYFFDNFSACAENGGTIYFIDIDNFKSVNEHYGHRNGDLLLKRIVAEIQSCLQSDEFVARLGSDEFVACTRAKADDSIDVLGNKILTAISNAVIVFGELSVSRSASIGCVTLSIGTDPNDALEMGDTAMRYAKGEGKNRLHRFSPKNNLGQVQMPSVDELRLGLERREVGYFLQPIVCCRKRAVRGYEALLRWERPNGQVLSPAGFLATMTSAYDAANARPLLEFAREASEWVTLNQGAFCYFNIDMSCLEKMASGGLDWVTEMVGQSPREKIVFEITEDSIDSELGKVVKIIEDLRNSGILIALDDFGVGASNLERLQRMPVDIVKMDKRFVHSAASDSKSRDILKGMIELSQTAGARVVVEGIEQEDQFEIVRDLGAEYAQGFHLGIPQPYHRMW